MTDITKYGHYISNYTPHSVTLLRPGAENTIQDRFDSVGVARCREIVQQLQPLHYDPFQDGGMVEEAPLVSKTFGEVLGLPAYDDKHPWRMFIVSQIVADALPARADLLVPTDVVRDSAGQVLGCRSFAWRPAK